MLHQHVFEFVHGDRRRDLAIADIGVDLRRQSAVMLGLLGLRRELNDRHATQLGVLNDIVARHEVDELGAELFGEIFRQLVFLVGLALVADRPPRRTPPELAYSECPWRCCWPHTWPSSRRT